MLYKIYGYFRRCDVCDCDKPLAVGVCHQPATLRLIKYRVLRRTLTPKCIRDRPECYFMRELHSNLDWQTAYTIISAFEADNLPVLTCSRT
jgi:hypothetical protein